MKARHTLMAAIRVAACISALFLFSPVLQAAEKKIVVIEKSADAKDKTNHEANGTNLPPGSTAVEVSSLADAATKILAELGPGDCIKELHFRGHAAPGIQGVGDGVNNDPDKHINGVNDTVWKTALAGLKGKFCPGAMIHFWGCSMGADSAGAAKLKQVADFFGVTVKAPTEVVTAGEQTTYTGGIKTVEPSSPPPTPTPAPQQKAKKKKHEEKQAIMIASSSVDLDFFAFTQQFGMFDEDSLTYHSEYDSTHFTTVLSGMYNGLLLNVTYSGVSSGNASGPWNWSSAGFYGSTPWNGTGSASYNEPGVDIFSLSLMTSLFLGGDPANSSYIINGSTSTISTTYLSGSGGMVIGTTSFPVEPSLTIDWVNKTVTNDGHVWGVEVIISEWTFDEIEKAVDGILKWVKDQVFPTLNVSLITASGTTGAGGMLTVAGLPGAAWDDRMGIPGYLTLTLMDQAGNVLATMTPEPDGSFAVTLPELCTCVTGLVLVATDAAGNSFEATLPWTPPAPPPVDPRHIAILAMGTCVDQDFFALTQTNGMIDHSVNYHASYTAGGGWNAILSGVYNGVPLSVTYNGTCTSSPGTTLCNWTSSGFYGSQPWNSSGTAIINGPGGPFMVNYNSNISIGTKTAAANYTVNGVETPSAITYTGSSGAFTSNPPLVTIADVGPSITINTVDKTVTNDVHLGWGVDVVLSEWTFDEIVRAVDGILKWVKDNYFPVMFQEYVQFLPAALTGPPGTVDDDRIQIPGYLTIQAFNQDMLPLGAGTVDTDGSFFIPVPGFAGVTEVIIVVTDNAGNATTYSIPLIPATLNVPSTFVEPGPPVCFNATQDIWTGGAGNIFVVLPGGNAQLIAGHSIHMLDGTIVLPGGYLHAYISPGGPWCPPPDLPAAPVTEIGKNIEGIPLSASVRVYPNPTTGLVTVSISGEESPAGARITVTDQMGRQVAGEGNMTDGHTVIDLTKQRPGWYILKVETQKECRSFKLVKM